MSRYKKRSLNFNQMPGLFDNILADLAPDPIEVPPPPAVTKRTRGRKGGGNVDPQPEGTPLDPLSSTTTTDKLRFISFGSGSSGNCAYLGDDNGGVLIDAGVEPRYVIDELRRSGVDIKQVSGIILTHDHSDHVRYAYNLLRTNRHLRLYCTPRILNGLLRRHSISRRIKDYHQPIFKEFPFHLSDFTITPFETMHDGSDNVGFLIVAGNHRFVIATDMGTITERARHYIQMANYLMIESNYDLTMLLNGPYPEYLQARIIGDKGHMDNVQTASFLANIHTPQLRYIMLCHLSHDNNTPQIALAATKEALQRRGLKVVEISAGPEERQADVRLCALPRFESTGTIILRPD